MWKYVGEGSFMPGVPARDLTAEEGESYGVRGLPPGLYEESATPPIPETPAEEETEPEGVRVNDNLI
jgi:hypothetical protein